MNPAFAEDGRLHEPLRQLVLALTDPERPHLVFAVAADETVRREAMAELAERLSGTYAVAAFDFADPPRQSLPRFCRSLSGDGPVCVIAHGLAKLAASDREALEEAVDLLNAHREDVRACALVLALAPAIEAEVVTRAPDFADWRTAAVTLELPPGETLERSALGRLALAEAEELRRQGRRIEEMLERPNLAPAMAAELEKQLEIARRRLGRITDLRRDYCQQLIDELRDHIVRGFAPQVGGRVLSLPLAKIFLPLEALEGRPALAEVAEDDLRRQAEVSLGDELGWLSRRDEIEKRSARLQARQAAQRQLALADLLKERRAVLLGDPGTGKTTITRYVAYALAADDRTHVGESVRGLLPVLVRLANFGRAFELDRGLDLLGYVETQLVARPELGRMLRETVESGKCLIILDGLDEVTDPELRLDVTQRIQALVAAHGANRYLVTSRIVGYDRSPLTRELTHATLQELGPEDKERFVRLWYAAIRSEIRDSSHAAGEAALVEALRTKPQIARMAANPLLLTIMVLMHWRGVKLPGRRVQVYQNATDTLIEYWTSERVELDAEEVKQILAPIAHYILSTHVGGVIARRDLVPRLRAGIEAQRGCGDAEAAALAEQLLGLLSEQSGIFLERGLDAELQPVYGFLHQTFGEYMAALHLASEMLEGTFAIEHYIHRSVWHEPLLLLAGHLALISPGHAGRLLRAILDYPCPFEAVLRRNVLLAVDCLCDDVQVKPALRDEVLAAFAELLRDPAPQVREAAVERCKPLVVTRHRNAAAAAVEEVVRGIGAIESVELEHRVSLTTALVRLGAAESAEPLFASMRDLQQHTDLRLRLEGWPEKGIQRLIERQKAGQLEIDVGVALSSCGSSGLDAQSIQDYLGSERFRSLLEELVELEEDPRRLAELRWISVLASPASPVDVLVELTRPESPAHLRRLAAARLLESDARDDAVGVLRELIERDPAQAAAAAGHLSAARIEVEADWSLVRDEALVARSSAAIASLLQAGETALALPATIHFLALPANDHARHQVMQSLIENGQRTLGLAMARWLALRPGYPFRLEATEALLEAGRISDALPALRYLACECQDRSSQQACLKLLVLREAEAALPILCQEAHSQSPERRYQASLALALANRAPYQDLPQIPARSELKLGIVDERYAALDDAFETMCAATEKALDRLPSGSDAELRSVEELGRFCLGWMKNGPAARFPGALRRLMNSPWAAIRWIAAQFDLRQGRVGAARDITGALLQRHQELSTPLLGATLDVAGRLRDTSSTDLMVNVLRCQETARVIPAARALGSLGSDSAREALSGLLANEDDGAREAAVTALGELRDPAATPHLVAALKDSATYVRLEAVWALGILRRKEHLRPIAAALGDEDPDVAWNASYILGLFPGPEATREALPFLDHERAEAREAALSVLAEGLYVSAETEYRTKLVAAIDDPNSSVAQQAITALGRLRHPEAQKALAEYLRSEKTVPYGLRIGPGQRGKIVELLLHALRNSNRKDRLQIAKLLFNSRKPPILRERIAVLFDSDLDVQLEAARSIERYLPDPALPDLLVEALGDGAASPLLEDSEQLERLAGLLKISPIEPGRLFDIARFTLRRLENPAAVEPVLSLLGSEHGSRQLAASAAGTLGDKRAVRALLVAFCDDDLLVRANAAHSIDRVRDPCVLRVLIRLLDDRNLVSQAARALGYLGDSAAIPHLMASLVDVTEHYEFQRAGLALALARLQATNALPLLHATASLEERYFQALVHLDAKSALETLDRFAPKLRQESWARRLRGEALWRLGDAPNAAEALSAAVEQNPYDVSNLLALAHFHIERDDPDAAAQLVEKALELDPWSAVALLTRAVVLELRGEAELAREALADARWQERYITDADDLRFDHFWRDKAVAAVDRLQVYEMPVVPVSEVAEPEAPYDP